jgi:O-acetyl-ADP-ribose deacetylase (regulator of RNase III)
MKILIEKLIKNVRIKVAIADITQIETDASVNAANQNLQHGGGVAFAISKTGGPIIQSESNDIIIKQGPLNTGDAVLTSGGNLKSKFVIHTVGPVWREGDEEKKLEKAVNSVMKIAKKYDLRSISIPAISCGIFGFPAENGTKIIFKTVKNFITKNDSSLEEIYFVGLESEIAELFKRAVEDD